MALSVVSAAAVDPVLVADIKTHLRIDHSSDDSYLTSLITLATKRVENDTHRALITQTLKVIYDSFPGGRLINLIRSPVQSVTHVKYYPETGTLTTLSSDYYRLDSASTPARIILKDGWCWPTTWDDFNAIEIQFVAGYGASGASVPPEIVHAIKLLVGHYYNNREASTGIAMPQMIADGYEALVGPYRIYF